MTGPVFRAKAAAEYCGLSYGHFRTLLCQGQGPKGYKHGRLNVFYAADLDEWLSTRLIPIVSGRPSP